MLSAVLLAAGVSFLATPLVKLLAYKVGAVDVPKDNRRMHKVPIPRLGGLAIFIAFMFSVLIFGQIDTQTKGILLGATIIVVLGVLDDIMALPALPKFVVQIFAAVVVVLHGCRIRIPLQPGARLGGDLYGAARVAFRDDHDHLDRGDHQRRQLYRRAGRSGCRRLRHQRGDDAWSSALMVAENNIAVIMAALLGACLGFIPYNLNPAKIFMGDTGSTFLGFILATVSIQGLFKLYAIISFAVPFLILGVPIFDICFAIIRRLAKGQNPMKADRGHVHHRLIDMGFSQKQSVAITYMLTAILGLAAVVLTSSGEVKALILIGSVFVVGAIGFELIFIYPRKHGKAPDGEAAVPPAEDEGEL